MWVFSKANTPFTNQWMLHSSLFLLWYIAYCKHSAILSISPHCLVFFYSLSLLLAPCLQCSMIIILPGSSCNLSCDIFSSCTAITCSPDTCTPATSKEKSHPFLQPVQCRKTGSASVGNWNTRCGWGNRTFRRKVTSACTSFKFSHKDFLKVIILFWVTESSLLCSRKETIDLPHAVEKKKEKMKRKKKERKN